MLTPIPRADLPSDTETLARFLIGAHIVHDLPPEHPQTGRLAARIVETEAYLPHDAASHTFRGETPRNRPMFGERGHAYVYLNYGVFWLFNVSSEAPGIGAGVLIRAVEPTLGLPLMRTNRTTPTRPAPEGPALTNGPGKLTIAMGIGPQHTGLDLCAPGPLFVSAPTGPAPDIAISTRIGITKDAHRPLRFFERNNPYVSGPKRLNAG